MNKAFKITGVAACLWTVLVLGNGHWLALQSFAWARMTVRFAQHDSLGVALSKTFSGRYPCPLCEKVQRGWRHEREQEKKQPWLQTEKLPEAVWQVRCLTVPPLPMAAAGPEVIASAFYFEFTESPPTPPPRA